MSSILKNIRTKVLWFREAVLIKEYKDFKLGSLIKYKGCNDIWFIVEMYLVKDRIPRCFYNVKQSQEKRDREYCDAIILGVLDGKEKFLRTLDLEMYYELVG